MSDLWDHVANSQQTDRVVAALEALTAEVKAQREATERVEVLVKRLAHPPSEDT